MPNANHKFGTFTDDGKAFIVTDPATPRTFDQFLWNETVFSNVTQTGVGYLDYQFGQTEAIQLLTGNGRVCDFDVFGRDNLMSRLIYLRDNETGVFWNVNWEPVCRMYETFRCEHGLGYTAITNITEGIEAVFTLTVPTGSDAVELWRLQIINRSGAERALSVFVYNQFQFRYKWGFDSYGDMLFRSSGFSERLNSVVASKHPHVRPHDYLTGFLTADRPINAYDGVKSAFTGQYGSLTAPLAVTRGYCSGTPGSSDATIGAAQFNLTLPPDKTETIDLILGATDGEAGIETLRAKYLGCFDACLDAVKTQKNAMCSHHTVHTPDAHLDEMFNYWLKQQSAFGAAWCRWGWMGYRDIVQHGYGVCSYDPMRTAEILRSALRYQYQNGLALRGWNPPDTKPYSDSALWLAFTLEAYIRETGDTAFLAETIPYYDGGSATVLGHVEQALYFLETHKGAHGLCLIKFGDWNDSLTTVGKDGRGESVWLSQAYGEALRRMAELYAHIGREDLQRDCLARYEAIRKAVMDNAWDGNWYVRCFDDEGRKIGSVENDEGKIFIESQAWALITDMAGDRAEMLIKACDERLLTPQGYRLLSPTFTQVNENIGRISSMEPGICENGTIYAHVNIWMILGLLRAGRVEQAYEAFKRVTPGYYESEESHKLKNPPYIYANCYYGPDHKNNAWQMEFTWVTGSCAWYNNVLAENFFGLRADYGGLRIDPRIPREWDGFTYERRFQDALYAVTVRNPKHLPCGAALAITVDGVCLDGNVLPQFKDGKRHNVEVLLTDA